MRRHALQSVLALLGLAVGLLGSFGATASPADGTVLSVSYDLMIPDVTREEVLQQMHGFVDQRGIDIPVLIYDADDYDAINERFGLPGPIPVTLAFDRNGAIVDRQEGEAGKDRFIAMMLKALGN